MRSVSLKCFVVSTKTYKYQHTWSQTATGRMQTCGSADFLDLKMTKPDYKPNTDPNILKWYENIDQEMFFDMSQSNLRGHSLKLNKKS